MNGAPTMSLVRLASRDAENDLDGRLGVYDCGPDDPRLLPKRAPRGTYPFDIAFFAWRIGLIMFVNYLGTHSSDKTHICVGASCTQHVMAYMNDNCPLAFADELITY